MRTRTDDKEGRDKKKNTYKIKKKREGTTRKGDVIST